MIGRGPRINMAMAALLAALAGGSASAIAEGSFVLAPPAAPRTPSNPVAPAPEPAVARGDLLSHGASALRSDLLAERIETLWLLYKSRHIDPSGRIVDNGNGGISHSEGQGYAMVLAALADDRATFDRVWAWTQRELYAPGSDLAAWKWDPKSLPHVSDPNNATDGDLLIAWGLSVGADRWNDEALRSAGRRIARAVWDETIIDSGFGRVLLPGRSGFDAGDRDDGPVVNLSYWVFPAIEAMAALAPEHDWAAVEASGRRLAEIARFGPLRLPTDWVSLAGPEPTPAAGFDPTYGYNAVRIPLYLAMSRRTGREELRPFAGQWNAAEDVGPFVIDVATGAARDVFGGAGFKILSALTDCIVSGMPLDPGLSALDDDFYYPATLGLLALNTIEKEHQACL